MSKKELALEVKSVSKDFLLPHERKNSIKEVILHFNKPTFEKMHALDDINFEVEKGEFFGIVGRNGSGKSTLLKLIGGIYQPTKGTINVNGTLTPFIELGIGFNPELTGRENVYLNGAILGLTRKEVQAKYKEIVEFAELERFMDQKLKNYSSGMQVRLAFSIAMQAHNDILLIDEVLAVGDAAFQRKCFSVFKDIKKHNKTVVFVTHDMSAVEEYCDRAMLIEKSKIVTIGKSYVVAREYRRLLNDGGDITKETKASKRFGNGDAEIVSAEIKSNEDKNITRLTDEEESFRLQVKVRFVKDVEKPIFGITIRDAAGTPLMISNTKNRETKVGSYSKGETVTVTWSLKNIFNTGKYSISPAIAANDAVTMLDWRDDFLWLRVDKDNYFPGPIHYNYTIELSDPTAHKEEKR